MTMLRSIQTTCTPRPDVLGGHLSDAMFAANLDKIVRNPAAYPVYGDSEQFFALTHPTKGLRTLLARTFGRLTGAKVPGAEHGVIRSQTSFGGGKTHGLIAAYYLAKGKRPLNLEDFVDPALLPKECQVAAVVGDALDPVSGLMSNGVRSFTMWGEIAAQLGDYDEMQANDEQRTAPGTGTWAKVVGEKPTVIIIDEIAQHLRQLVSSGNEDVRRQATAVPAFLKALFDFAASTPNVVIILTLATRSDAYGRETSDIEEMLNNTEGSFQEAMADTKSVLARFESIVRPAEDSEIAQILKRRLFQSIEPRAAAEAGSAYRSYYEDLTQKGIPLPGGADQPTAYGELVELSYPFHPELVRVLDQRLSTIPTFQRARGALKLLAEVISGIWAAEHDVELLNVADVALSFDAVLTHLTDGLGRDDYKAVALADIATPSAHAPTLDKERFAGKPPYATRAATTVFIHSLEQISSAGAGRGDYLLGTLQAGNEPTLIDEALAQLTERAWYLDYTGTRYRFKTEPNANAIIAEEARNIPNSQVNQELKERIEQAFQDDGPVKTRLNATGPIDVPDEARLQLVVLHHDDVAVRAKTAMPAPERILQIRDSAGAAGAIRRFRNGVVFLVADADQIANMRDKVRAAMATERITKSGERMAQFSPEVRKKIENLADTAALDRKVAIARCYSHLYYPVADAQNGNLHHCEMPAKEKGATPDRLTRTVPEVLRDENKIRETAFSTDYFRSKAWPKDAEEVAVSAAIEWSWRDHGAPIVLRDALFSDVIADGVTHGAWVYYDPEREKAWTSSEPKPNVVLDGPAMLYTLERAEALRLLRKTLRVDDITAVLSTKLTGVELRETLEGSLGHEPTKKELTQVLVRAASGGTSARVVVVVGEPTGGAKPATESQLERTPLDSLVVLTPAVADEIGIDRGTWPPKSRPISARGTAGVALGSVAGQVSDRPDSPGIVMLKVTTTADPGEGVKDVRALGQAIPMMQRCEISVSLDLRLEFSGLHEGVGIRLSGSSSAYEQVEDALVGLAKMASEVAGSMTLEVRPSSPMVPDNDDWRLVHKALTSVDPGEIEIRAELA